MMNSHQEARPTKKEITEPEAHTERPAKRLWAKHPLAIRWFHWVNFPVLMGMIWSGLLIYWANDVYRLGSFRFFPQPFYDRLGVPQRLAEGMAWHFALAWAFALNGLGYVLYLAFSGEWKHIVPGRGTLREAVAVVLHELRIRRAPLPRAKFNGAQRIAYSGVVVMGAGSLATGLAILKPVQLAWLSSPLGRIAQAAGWNATAYEAARWLHFWLTIGFCAFFLVHVLQVARAGWNNFRAMVTGYEVVTEAQAQGAPSSSSPTRSDSAPPQAPQR